MSVDLGPLKAPTPITPEEAQTSKSHSIPMTIIEVFNTLISERYPNVTITWSEVLDLLKVSMPHHTRAEIIRRKWLDVDALYRKAGWVVDFEKPDRGDAGESKWTFTPKK